MSRFSIKKTEILKAFFVVEFPIRMKSILLCRWPMNAKGKKTRWVCFGEYVIVIQNHLPFRDSRQKN